MSEPSSGIGVVIATRDRADRLAHTLRRLTALPEAPRIAVVDNASTDHTRTTVSALFPHVRLVTLPGNYGPAARNAGVRVLGNENIAYIAFSDDDSWWEPGALATAARLLDDHPRLGLLAARTRVGRLDTEDPLNAELSASPLGSAPDLPGTEVLGFLGCAAVVRRTAYLQVGGYHPLLFIGGEETLLAYDLAARGWGVSYCPQVVARHDPAPSPRPGRGAVLLRNELLTAWLRRPLPLALRRTRALAARARYQPDARRALAGALLRMPAVLRARTPLPPRTEVAARMVEERTGAASVVPGRPRRGPGTAP